MSGVGGCCGQSASSALFEQGIQKTQQQRELQQHQEQVSQGRQNETLAVQGQPAEGLKGSLFDGYA